jgi:uncharacterized membrane protein YkoI
MKKQLLIVALALVTLTACGSGGRVISQDTRTNTAPTASAANVLPGGSAAQSGTQSGSTNTETYITDEQAKEIAFAHAAVTQDSVSLLRVQFDFDDWKAVYEVDFYSGNIEYDYDIDAITGDILGYDMDQERFIGALPQTGNTSADAQSQTAQAAAPVAAQAPATQNTQAADPATQNAQAAIPDTQNTPAAAPAAAAPTPAPNSSSSNNSWISSADAENAALSHAGVTGADVSFLRSHMDRDDGRTLYEVSFYYNFMEYEYDIDALTGNILSFDQDYD